MTAQLRVIALFRKEKIEPKWAHTTSIKLGFSYVACICGKYVHITFDYGSLGVCTSSVTSFWSMRMMPQDGGMEFVHLSDRRKGQKERARDVMADNFVHAL